MPSRVVGGALINTCSLILKKIAISMPSKTKSSTFASAFNKLHNELDWPRLSRMRGGMPLVPASASSSISFLKTFTPRSLSCTSWTQFGRTGPCCPASTGEQGACCGAPCSTSSGRGGAGAASWSSDMSDLGPSEQLTLALIGQASWMHPRCRQCRRCNADSKGKVTAPSMPSLLPKYF